MARWALNSSAQNWSSGPGGKGASVGASASTGIAVGRDERGSEERRGQAPPPTLEKVGVGVPTKIVPCSSRREESKRVGRKSRKSSSEGLE